MPEQPTNFTDLEALNSHIQDRQVGHILIAYYNCKDYEGMVLGIGITFDTGKTKYELDLQWSSFGLDFYGDTLQESYRYQFESPEKLSGYLLSKYSIGVTDIPIRYRFDITQFPNPLKDEAKKLIFEAAWQRFQLDFKKGIFLDTSLKLVYRSI